MIVYNLLVYVLKLYCVELWHHVITTIHSATTPHSVL